MASYPDNYKFTSIEFGAEEKRKVFQRTTYDLLEAFGDVGGVYECLRIFLSAIIASFSVFVEQSLIAKYLYRYDKEGKDK